MPSVTDWEFMRLILIETFRVAVRSATLELGNEENDVMRAFDCAQFYGWDYENDSDWYSWTIKATQPEIAAAGLRRALENCRPRKCSACGAEMHDSEYLFVHEYEHKQFCSSE